MKTVDVKIPDDILERLAKIEPSQIGYGGKKWLPWEDKVLLENWEKKNKRELASLLGVHENTARTRYRKLTEGNK